MPALLLVLVLVLTSAPPAAATAWRWPLRGEVITPFRLAADRFAPGQHRGIDIAAAAGAAVRSACPGRVRFAGRLPGRGRVVSVECGALVATYLELATTTVARGTPVVAGERLGTVASSHLQLGARRTGRPNAYLDPLALLTTRDPPPLGATPKAKRPRPSPPPAPLPIRPPGAVPVRAADAAVPLAAWFGLALLLAGVPLGALSHRRRRRLPARAIDEGA